MQLRSIVFALLPFCFCAAWSAPAETNSGITSIALPGIAEKPTLGALVGLTHRFENPIFIDKITANIMYYPGIKLMDPSRVDVENDDPVLKRGNSLDFDEKHANLLIISPRASSCYFRETICFNLSPLSAPIFTANQQFKMYVAPFAGIQIQQRILGAQWFVAYDTNLFEDQSAWTLGASF